MRTFEVIPSVCQGESPKWEGKLVLRKFSFDEKFEFIQAMDVEVSKDGSLEAYKTSQQLDRVRRMVSLSEKYYVSVDLVNKATGLKVNSFEDMTFEDELHPVLIETASKLIEGFKVGNA